MEGPPLKVLWRRRAIADLARIREALPADSTPAIIERIEQAISRLSSFPLSGRLGRVEQTRELVVPRTPFIVAYVVQENVEILAVIHGSQNWPETLG
ncbi:MAG: type II toxin-antitoxin system RelE/ParE family toxin [Gemmatimonadaceae bacterium]|nr:type II toxin-antitoxin system RelE/ParE family toxin [Gloeobacterales cyanobacterium ES-bin-141]